MLCVHLLAGGSVVSPSPATLETAQAAAGAGAGAGCFQSPSHSRAGELIVGDRLLNSPLPGTPQRGQVMRPLTPGSIFSRQHQLQPLQSLLSSLQSPLSPQSPQSPLSPLYQHPTASQASLGARSGGSFDALQQQQQQQQHQQRLLTRTQNVSWACHVISYFTYFVPHYHCINAPSPTATPVYHNL